MTSYQSVVKRPGRLQAMTGLTETEFNALLPYFQQAFEAYMRDHTIDGRRRLGRRYTTYRNTPLPTAADKLLFILSFMKTNPLQEVHGELFGISQSNANKWIHLLHTVLNLALAAQCVLPARTAADLARMLQQDLANATPAVPAAESLPAAADTSVDPTTCTHNAPLFSMMARSDRSIARKML